MSYNNHYYSTEWMCFLYEYLGALVDNEANSTARDRLRRLKKKFQPHARYVELTHINAVQLITILQTALRDIDKNTALKNDDARNKAKETISGIIKRLEFNSPLDARDS